MPRLNLREMITCLESGSGQWPKMKDVLPSLREYHVDNETIW